MIHEEMFQVGNPEVEMNLCFGLSKMYGFKDLLAKNLEWKGKNGHFMEET